MIAYFLFLAATWFVVYALTKFVHERMCRPLSLSPRRTPMSRHLFVPSMIVCGCALLSPFFYEFPSLGEVAHNHKYLVRNDSSTGKLVEFREFGLFGEFDLPFDKTVTKVTFVPKRDEGVYEHVRISVLDPLSNSGEGTKMGPFAEFEVLIKGSSRLEFVRQVHQVREFGIDSSLVLVNVARQETKFVTTGFRDAIAQANVSVEELPQKAELILNEWLAQRGITAVKVEYPPKPKRKVGLYPVTGS